MSQHDYNLENATGAAFRNDLNDALEAIASNNAGSTAPTTTFPHMLWFDQNDDLMKIRDEANSAWVVVAKKDANGWTPYRQGAALGSAAVRAAEDTLTNGSALPDGAAVTTFVAAQIAAKDSADANLENDPLLFARRGIVADAVEAGGKVKAWVNFNGTGAVAINDSFNVSSITDNGAGDYTVNFANPLADGNYAVSGSIASSSGANTVSVKSSTSAGAATLKSASQVRVVVGTLAATDYADISIMITR